MKLFRTLILLSCLFATCAAALGAIRPSFQPEESAWLATDIVVVTEGKAIDGVVQVIETLKGDLKPGAILTLPELAEFKAKEARLIDNGSWLKTGPDRFITGNRMILFLRDQTKIPAEDEEQNGSVETEGKSLRWSGAHPLAREIKYSTAWIEEEKLYALFQLTNPGPSVLCRTSLTGTSLRNLIGRVTRDQTALNAAAALPDASDRAQALRPFINSSMPLARDAAFVKLTECGSAALPALRAELEDGSNPVILDDVVEALAKVGGRDAGPLLTKFLAGELEFWKRTAPALDLHWRRGTGFGSNQIEALKAVEPLDYRVTALLHTIYALRALRYAESANLVADVSNLWRSLPQMNGDRVDQACDDYFRTVGRAALGTKRLRLPEYEIHFNGNKIFSSEELTRKTAEYVGQYDELETDYQGDLGDGIFSYAVRQLSSFYASQGYLDAKVGSAFYTTERGTRISVDISEGEQYRMDEFKIEGAQRISAEHIRDTFPLRAGDIVNRVLIDKWESELEQSYSRLGYLDSDIDFEHTRGGEFKITITEGDQFAVQSVKFIGKSKYSEEQLANAFSLRSGEKFTGESLDSGIKKLNEQFGLELDREKDVELETNDRTSSVTVVIFLDHGRPPKDSFGRWMNKRKWSL